MLDKCIPYNGNNYSAGGYRSIVINNKKFYVHRLVAMLFLNLGLQDTTTIVRHKCDNPNCINPDHLELVQFEIIV